MDYPALNAELLAGHPDTGAYSLDDAIAASELNAVNRPDQVSIAEVLKFLVLDNVHSTDGQDTQARAIWTRLKEVTKLAETPDGGVANPWGSVEVGNVTEIQQIKTGQLFDFFTLSAQGQLPVDLTDSKFRSYVAGAQSAGCMSTAQETALLALADNLQSRAEEIGLGKVRTGDVTFARAI